MHQKFFIVVSKTDCSNEKSLAIDDYAKDGGPREV